MAPVEFICHSKHFKGILKLAHEEVVAVPTTQRDIIRALFKSRGVGGLVRIILGEQRLIDLKPLVERNLVRRQIRLPWLYSTSIARALYRFILLAKARLATALVEQTFAAHPHARALAFNGFLMPDAITLAISKALRRERLVLELGFFPGTTQVDVQGVNDDCTLPREPAFYEFADPEVPKDRPEQLVRRPTKQKEEEQAVLPPDYVFVPMQVPSDMQILHHSPWIGSMVHFYEALLELADKNPRLHLVVKEHPSFPLSIRRKVRQHPRITFANHNETRALIEGARAVITVNSTVGLESLLLGKKVITLGRTYYNIPGLVLHAENNEQLEEQFSRLDTWEPDAVLRDQFIRYVYNVFLLRADRNQPTPEFLDALRRRANRSDTHNDFLRLFENQELNSTTEKT